MAIELGNGVRHMYGPRDRGDEARAGSAGTRGHVRDISVEFGGDSYSQVSFVLPAGTVVVGQMVAEVTQAFALGGTTPTINVGVSGSHGTNYLGELSEAQAEAVGTYSVASAGTLLINTPLAAAATIIVGLDGTSPTITSAGKVKISVPVRNI